MKKDYARPLSVFWLLLVTVLFCLPGSAFPKASWLSKIYFDKWVHMGIFTVLVFLWSWNLSLSGAKAFAAILVIAVLYGLLIEIVQHSLVANRSFDWGDLLADLGGSLLGLWAWRVYKKNRPL